MKTLLSVFIITLLPTSIVAGTLDGKGIFCSSINQGFFFEEQNRVRIYRISGMEVWDWEQSSYDEVGAHQIDIWVGQWKYNKWLSGEKYKKGGIPSNITALFNVDNASNGPIMNCYEDEQTGHIYCD